MKLNRKETLITPSHTREKQISLFFGQIEFLRWRVSAAHVYWRKSQQVEMKPESVLDTDERKGVVEFYLF